MTKTHIITIDGIEVALRCSGATPILYRSQFKGDLIAEFNRLYMTREEVPHSVTCVVNLIESDNRNATISADIIVDRENLKKILVGKTWE